MKIKVCGITDLNQMQALQQLGVEYAGLIFYEGSKRFANEKLKNKGPAIKEIKIKKVGVFVDAGFETISKAIVNYGLSAVQLHGDETADFCKKLMNETEVLKVFRIKKHTNVDEMIQPFQNTCTYFLFDTDSTLYGGSGKQFNWAVLANASITKPFFLSGGIGLEDVQKIKEFKHPFLYGVDVNSKFETEPGKKDIQKVKKFITCLKP